MSMSQKIVRSQAGTNAGHNSKRECKKDIHMPRAGFEPASLPAKPAVPAIGRSQQGDWVWRGSVITT
jgi:hypothetical protein